MELQINDGIINTAPVLISAIKTLQQMLKDLGMLAPAEPVDGEFGTNTEKAVKLFQSKQGLDVDGVVGQQTWADLLKIDPAQVVIVPRPALAAGKLNQAIATTAASLHGMSTVEGPDHGNEACAWMVNRVLKTAGIATLGDNPDYVPSLKIALEAGRGNLVPSQEAKSGDLVLAYEEKHIGIYLGEGRVLSNSSSRHCFRWESDIDFDNAFNGFSTVYRLIQ